MDAIHALNEEIGILLKTLQQAEEPLTVNQIKKQLPPGKLSETGITEILSDQLNQRQVYRFKPYGGKSDRYWTRSHEEYAREVILKALTDGPISRSELNEKTKAKLRDCSEVKRKELLNALIKEGAAREWPATIGGRSKLLSTRPPDAQFYIEQDLMKLRKKLGLSQEQLLEDAQSLLKKMMRKRGIESEPGSQPEAKDFAQVIFDHMARIEPASVNGALVSLTELRRAVRNEITGKEGFDRVILDLAMQGRVAVHKHDYPASLSKDELDELVTDGNGRYYIGIAVRV